MSMKKMTTAVLGASLVLALAPTTEALAQQPAPAAPVAQAAPPAAAESADQLLARSDKQARDFKDAFFHFKMKIYEPSGQVREVEFTTMQKGQKRLVRFLAPGDIKGMGFLSESADVMYALLPAFGNRIRRLGTSQMNQAFMGSDLSSSDMSAADLSALYSAAQDGTEGELAVLQLTMRKDLKDPKPEWPCLRLSIDPKTAVVHKVRYLDASCNKEKPLRTATRSDFQKDASGYLTPGKLEYKDHRRNDHKTELILVKATFNNNYADDQFTQRQLQKN